MTTTSEQIAEAQSWALKVSKAKGSQYTPASKNAAAYILSLSPLTNEPVGVTISREDAELFKSIASALSDDRKFITCRPDFYRGLCDRLSAITGEKG